jgi:hypothetical protein
MQMRPGLHPHTTFLIGSENIERLVKAMPTGIGRIKWRSLASLQFSDDKHREENKKSDHESNQSASIFACTQIGR